MRSRKEGLEAVPPRGYLSQAAHVQDLSASILIYSG